MGGVIRPEVAELVRLAELEGWDGVARWVKDRLDALRGDPAAADALYWETKEQSVGAALLLAHVLGVLLGANLFMDYALKRPSSLPAGIDGDLRSAFSRDLHMWVTGVCHILMPHIQDRARRAFESGDVLCGLHRFYCGGGGPDSVVFTSFAAFEERVRGARAGDDFMLVSVQRFARDGTLLEPTLEAVRRYTQTRPSGEVMVVRSGLHPARVDILWDGNIDEDDVPAMFAPTEGLYAVPFEWEQEFFISAKKPNEWGAVPLGGAY